MADFQVTCVRKPHQQSPHEEISHLGTGGTLLGKRIWASKEIIEAIDLSIHTFYTLSKEGRRAEIIVVREGLLKSPYLRTHSDRILSNNLLELDECL